MKSRREKIEKKKERVLKRENKRNNVTNKCKTRMEKEKQEEKKERVIMRENKRRKKWKTRIKKKEEGERVRK